MKKNDRQYLLMGLDESDIDCDPFKQFLVWYKDACDSGMDLPNAFTLSTASKDGAPSSRVLLLKNFNENSFVFYTNSLSRKASEMDSNPHVAICFFWNVLERQVRIGGQIESVEDSEADDYFAQRPRESRIGAWASIQGRVVSGRDEIDKEFARRAVQFENSETIPRPPFWKGYRVVPSVFEFWQGRANRMHDRIRYRKEESDWIVERLAP